jgi:hypothetical protein
LGPGAWGPLTSTSDLPPSPARKSWRKAGKDGFCPPAGQKGLNLEKRDAPFFQPRRERTKPRLPPSFPRKDRFTALCPLPSALCPLPSALCPLPSALCPLPSALCPLPSALCPLNAENGC